MMVYDWARWGTLAAGAFTLPRQGVAALEATRSRRLDDLLTAACAAPHLAERLGTRPLAGWRLQDLPTFDKAELMAHFDGCVTDPTVRLDDLRRFVADRAFIGLPFRERFGVWHSSGSTGQPGLFVCSEDALTVYDAVESMRRPVRRSLARLLDPLMAAERIAFVGAIDGHFAGIANFERFRRMNAWLAPRMRAFSILQPVEELVASLNRFGPTQMFTYPTTAVILAEERLRGRLKCTFAELVVGGETFTPGMRRLTRRAFDCPVSCEYGASEFLPLAMECNLGALHLNADWVILEPADSAGTPVPPGTRGTCCLLTNLANHLQPLIRYRLDDRVLIETETCACGSALPVLSVHGRSDDLLRMGDGDDGVMLSPMALATVLEDDAQLFDFQLVQEGRRRLALCCRHEAACDVRALQRGRDALCAWLQRQGVGRVEVRCRLGTPPRTGPAGKLKRVVGMQGEDADARPPKVPTSRNIPSQTRRSRKRD